MSARVRVIAVAGLLVVFFGVGAVTASHHASAVDSGRGSAAPGSAPLTAARVSQ